MRGAGGGGWRGGGGSSGRRGGGGGGGRGFGGILRRYGRADGVVEEDLRRVTENARLSVPSPAPVPRAHLAPVPVSAKSLVAVVARPDDCVLCGVCVDSCPSQAMELRDTVVIDQKLCTACSVCVNICPNDVLEMSER